MSTRTQNEFEEDNNDSNIVNFSSPPPVFADDTNTERGAYQTAQSLSGKGESVGGWFSQFLDGMNPFSKKDEADLQAIAQRRSNGAPLITDKMTVEEMSIHAGMTVGELVAFLSSSNKEDEAVIDSFSDETEHPVGTAMHQFWTFFFYAFPPIIAMIVGFAIGATYGGSIATYALCMLFEAIPIILMYATAKQLSRALSGIRSAWLGVAIIGTFFVLVAMGSAVAQWSLFANSIDMHKLPEVVGAVIRTFTLPLAEIVAAVALPILQKKSLESHLHILDKRNNAKIQTNQKKVQNKISLINAAMQTKATLQKEEDYQKKQELANKLIDIVTKKILRDAEKSVNNDEDTDRGNNYRRDGRR